MKFLNQLFCKHVFKVVQMEYLRTKRELYGERWGMPTFANYQYYAEHQKCIKCEKKKVSVVKMIMAR